MKFNPIPKKGMPPKKAKKPLKRSPIKKKYGPKSKWNNSKENESKGRSGGHGKDNAALQGLQHDLRRGSDRPNEKENKRGYKNDGRAVFGKLRNKSSKSKKASDTIFPPKKKRKPILYRRKPSGELAVFKEIIEERGPYSQVSGQYLGEGLNAWWFSHVVPKSIAPELRLDKRNIILKTPDEHQTWENKKHTIKDNPKWKWIFELEEKLKIEIKNKK